MVLNQASLKRDGVQDFVSLRATALIIAAYAVFIIGYLVINPQLDYSTWKSLFSSIGMKIFTLLALISIAIHARIGLWQVCTDYMKNHRTRSFVLFIVNLVAFSYVATGLFVLWGV